MIKKKGVFKLIDCHDTHNQILYRSTAYNEKKKTYLNQDILISGTFFISLPCAMEGVTIRHASKEEEALFKERIPNDYKPTWKKFFIFESGSKVYFVVADKILFQENTKIGTSISSKLEEPMTDEEIAQFVEEVRKLDPEQRLKLMKSNSWDELK
ncbi:MAG: hypothetical protein JJU02_15915 [Cryomorphaceae bacterium]|nr:hypothetical protein [Cryomorphaceae bacterium]